MSPVILPIAFVLFALGGAAFMLITFKKRDERRRAELARSLRGGVGLGAPPNTRVGRGPARRLDL